MNSSEDNEYVIKLKSRFEKIEKLESTPMVMRDQAIQCLKTVLDGSSNLVHEDKNIIQNGIKSLKNIKEESMKEQFSVIYSQMCVLAVSSLEAILKDYFVDSFNKEIELEGNLKKKLCFYLEIRHLLVHKGGVVDKKFINSTKVLDANIKNYEVGDTVEIRSSDWVDMKQAFLGLLDTLTRGKVAGEIDDGGPLSSSREGV